MERGRDGEMERGREGERKRERGREGGREGWREGESERVRGSEVGRKVDCVILQWSQPPLHEPTIGYPAWGFYFCWYRA